MALLESIFIPLGTKMPDFELKDPGGNSFKASAQVGDRGLLVAFTCNHCPYAIAVWPRLIRLGCGFSLRRGKKTRVYNNLCFSHPRAL